MSNILMLEAFTPRSMMKLGVAMMQQSAEALRLFAPWPETRLAWREFQNKLEAFELFEHVDSVLEIPAQGEFRLPEFVEKAEALGPFRAVWATEGLGHYYAETFWAGTVQRNLLTDERTELPSKSLVALHAGMGLAIADRVVKTISPRSADSEIRRVLQQFVTACDENSREGYAGIAYESLGLVTRNLHPQMIRKLDGQLMAIDENLSGYFWHGVGRAIYFAPTNVLPGSNSSERALKATYEEAPHELGRRNALSGLAWAMTLVNIRHPEVLETFLKHHGDQLRDREAFINGVSSSVMIWCESTVDDPCLKAFYQYEPDPSNEIGQQRWERMVHRPCEEALESVYPVLKKRRRFGEVFRYVDLPALAQRFGQ